MKSIFVILCILFSFSTSAHMDIVYSVNRGNVHLQYLSGWGQLEIGNKLVIFTEILQKLVKNKFNNSERIHIYFAHDYTRTDSTEYTLGYGQFSYLDYSSYKIARDVKAKGLILIIRDCDFDIKNTLQLVNAAFSDVDFIKKNQIEYVAKSSHFRGDTLNTVLFSQIEKYISSSDSTLDKLLREKVFRNLQKVKEAREVDYYFQNNQFHFYNTMEPQEKWSETQEKYVVTKTFGEDILTVDNVFEIIGSHYDGHFVFIDDSTFYFISKFMDKVRGPFTIDSVGGGRRPVAKYYNEHTPIERFVLFLDSYRNAYGYDKVLFIPDSNLVISNYAEQENAFIKNIIKNKHKPLKQNMRRDIRPILAILAICIGVFVWLAIRKRRSSS